MWLCWKGTTGPPYVTFPCVYFNLYHFTIINWNHEDNTFPKSSKPFTESSGLRWVSLRGPWHRENAYRYLFTYRHWVKKFNSIFFSWSRKIIFWMWWDREKDSFEKRGIGLENHRDREDVIDKGFTYRKIFLAVWRHKSETPAYIVYGICPSVQLQEWSDNVWIDLMLRCCREIDVTPHQKRRRRRENKHWWCLVQLFL